MVKQVLTSLEWTIRQLESVCLTQDSRMATPRCTSCFWSEISGIDLGLGIGGFAGRGRGQLDSRLAQRVQICQLVKQLNFAGLLEVGLLDLIPE